jgi:hypothetical protein
LSWLRLIALAALAVIVLAPGLEHPLGAVAGAWALLARLVLRSAQDRATRFAVAVQEQFDQQVLDLLPAVAPPPAWEQVHQQARHRPRDTGDGWYPIHPQADPAIATLIAQRSSTGFLLGHCPRGGCDRRYGREGERTRGASS